MRRPLANIPRFLYIGILTLVFVNNFLNQFSEDFAPPPVLGPCRIPLRQPFFRSEKNGLATLPPRSPRSIIRILFRDLIWVRFQDALFARARLRAFFRLSLSRGFLGLRALFFCSKKTNFFLTCFKTGPRRSSISPDGELVFRLKNQILVV